MALDQLYNQIPDRQVSLKVKVLAAIRTEVGDDKAVQHEHKHQIVEAQQGPKIPPRAQSYQEWSEQNHIAQQAVEAEHEVIPSNGESQSEVRTEEQAEEEVEAEEEDSFSDPLAFLSPGSGHSGGDESGELRQPTNGSAWESAEGDS